MISIIIPAYKARKYIDECLSSIRSNVEHEVLIGVDNCEETYSHIKHLENVFFFTQNVGPYVIKNTLVDLAKYENILFFDSDDIMNASSLHSVCKSLENADYVKLSYVNFFGEKFKLDMVNTPSSRKMNDGIIAIKRSVFNELNGFYPWRCGADTELHNRLIYNNIKGKSSEDVVCYRRLHGENLTMKKETDYKSSIRAAYMKYISQCTKQKRWPNPQIKTIQEYVTDRNA